MRLANGPLQVYTFEFCGVYEWTSMGPRFDLPMVVWLEYQPSVTMKVRREGGQKMAGGKNLTLESYSVRKPQFSSLQPQPSFLQHTTTITIFTTYNHTHHFYNIQPQSSFLQHTTTIIIFITHNHNNNNHFYNIQLQPQPSFLQHRITTIIFTTYNHNHHFGNI